MRVFNIPREIQVPSALIRVVLGVAYFLCFVFHNFVYEGEMLPPELKRCTKKRNTFVFQDEGEAESLYVVTTCGKLNSGVKNETARQCTN